MKCVHNHLDVYSLQRLNQEEREISKRPITSNEIKVVILKLPTNQSAGLEGFTGEFYQTFRGEVTLTLLKRLQKITEESTLCNLQ